MPREFELTDPQWRSIEFLSLGRAGDRGRRGVDNRMFVNAVIWVMRSEKLWRQLPKHFGNWKTAHQRFIRWRKSGAWQPIFDELTNSLNNHRAFDYAECFRERLATRGTTVPRKPYSKRKAARDPGKDKPVRGKPRRRNGPRLGRPPSHP